MWNVITDYGYLDEVWSRLPVYFHGKVIGFYISQTGEGIMYVCESLQGSLIHVKERDLQRRPVQQALVVSKKG